MASGWGSGSSSFLATSNASNFDLVASTQAAQAAANAAPMGSNLGNAAESLKGEIAEFERHISDQTARRLEEDRQVHCPKGDSMRKVGWIRG
jgi:hypothetical protein